MEWGKTVFPPYVCTLKMCRIHCGVQGQCKFAWSKHFPAVSCQLTAVLTCSCTFFVFRLLPCKMSSALFLMPPKKSKQVVHTEYTCRCGTLSIWFGVMRELGPPPCMPSGESSPHPRHSPLAPLAHHHHQNPPPGPQSSTTGWVSIFKHAAPRCQLHIATYVQGKAASPCMFA